MRLQSDLGLANNRESRWFSAPLLGLGASADDIDDIIALRISGHGNRRTFANQRETGAIVFRELRDVVTASSYPAELLDTGRGDLRSKYGVQEIRDRDCHVWATTNQFVGYAFVCGRTLLLYFLDSATDCRIKPPGEALGFNPFSEFVIRAMLAYSPTNVRFAVWSRGARLLPHAARVQEVASRIPRLVFWEGDRIHDFHATNAAVVTGVNNGVSIAENLLRKVSLLVGKLNKLAKNCYPFGRHGLPFTHRFVLREQPDGTRTVDTGVPPEPVLGMGDVLLELVRMATEVRLDKIAADAVDFEKKVIETCEPGCDAETGQEPGDSFDVQGAVGTAEASRGVNDEIAAPLDGQDPDWRWSWAEIGDRCAELGLRLPKPHDGLTHFADLTSRVGRAGAARALLAPSRISLWQTGAFRQRIYGTIPGHIDYNGWVPNFDGPDDRFGHWDFDLAWGKPVMSDGTIGVPVADATWDLLGRRVKEPGSRAARHRKRVGRVASREDKSLLAGLPRWVEADGFEYDVFSHNDEYIWRRRPATRARDEKGSPRGWLVDEGERVRGFKRIEADSRIATMLRGAATALGDRVARLSVRARAPMVEEDRRRRELEVELDRLEADKDDKETQARGANALANHLAAMDKIDDAAAKHAEASTLSEEVARLSEAIRQRNDDLETLSEQEQESDEAVDLTQLAVVAEVVERSAGKLVSAELHDVVLDLFNGTFRVDHGSDTCNVRILADLAIPLLCGEIGEYRVEGEVPALRRRFRDAEMATSYQAQRRIEMARARLRDHRDIASIASKYELSDARVQSEVNEWLTSEGVPATLTPALVTCCIPEPSLSVWHALVPSDALAAEKAQGVHTKLQGYLVKRYLEGDRWQDLWCTHSYDSERRITEYLLREADPVQGLRMAPMAELLGVPFTVLSSFTQVSRAGRAIARNPVFGRSAFGRIGLLPCPHDDCPGPDGDGGGYMSHHLWTPETAPSGILCTFCHRLPVLELADVRFADGYFKYWTGPYGSRTGRRLAKANRGIVARDRAEYLPTVDVPDEARWLSAAEIAAWLGVRTQRMYHLCEAIGVDLGSRRKPGPGGGSLFSLEEFAAISLAFEKVGTGKRWSYDRLNGLSG